MRAGMRTLLVLVCLIIAPAVAWAQATIAGSVRDSSGAILPGVTVEAASPVLIEKVRTAITDGTGRYRIEDLRPGTYTVTFTLPGFVTVRSEGLLVSGTAVTTVNGELRVGGVQETITVTGETPVVDVQSTRRQLVLDNDTIRSIPSVRSYSSLLITVPGVQTDRNNVSTGPLIAIFPIHGGRGVESRLYVDGLNIGNAPGGNQPSHYVADVGNAQEVTFQTSGGLGESETAGLIMNLVPRTGGNSLSGQVFFSGFSSGMQSDNYSDELASRGVLQPNPLKQVYDFNAAGGGPIRRDALWYYVSARTQGQKRDTLNLYYNQNGGNPSAWTYVPDLSKPAFSDRTWESVNGRLTWQASQRNKLSFFWDEQWICRNCSGATSFSGSPTSTTSPEAEGFGDYFPQRTQQAKWTSPLTNKLLLEAGVGTSYYQWGNRERPDNATRDLVRVVNNNQVVVPATATTPAIVANLTYRSQNWLIAKTNSVNWTASASYITGAHSMKFGYQGNWWMDDRDAHMNSQDLQFNLANGVPTSLNEYINPFETKNRAMQTSFYAQEQWTLNRLTLQGALRYDNPWSWFPEQQVGPTRFFPNAIHFDRTDGVTGYHDITPRMGVAYDVFGTGKTAIKINLGKYLQGASTSNLAANANPAARLPFGPAMGAGFANPGVQRPWTDLDGDFTPDCNLTNPLAQSPATTGSADICGPINNLAFGTNQAVNRIDPGLLSGWGVRPSDWSFSASIQQELFPRTSVEVAYHRRWFDQFSSGGGLGFVTDNEAIPASGFDSFCINIPSDPRLPGGGGGQECGLLNPRPEFQGRVQNLIRATKDVGDDTRVTNYVDVTLNVRMDNGLNLQGGTSTGKIVDDWCDIRAQVPEGVPGVGFLVPGALNPFCHVESPWLTQFRALSSYTIPKVDVLVSAVYQDKPGSPGIDASLSATQLIFGNDPTIVAQLGRPLTDLPVTFVNFVAPRTWYGDRIRQLDFGAKKILRFGRYRTTVGVDFFNVLNSNVNLVYNTTYTPLQAGQTANSFLSPTEYMTPRVARVNAEFTW
jgi:hypothetical protein